MPMQPTKIQARPFDLMEFAKLVTAVVIPSNAYSNGKQAIVDALPANENVELKRKNENC